MASGSGGEHGRPWTAAASWAPAGGVAVEDAVSFETSADDAEAVPSPVVLARPAPDGDGDATPCEVTVHFRGKYEIHRVYVRSTARIYEIYYTTDPKDTTKDYLCTVRCGLAVTESVPSAEESMAPCSTDASPCQKHEHETKSVSSSIDEDSWVEVKIPELPVESNTSKSQEQNVIGVGQETTLAHYEATAEITDASPCVSLTVRLLSLQSKTSVHIEEIYIFADPVEAINDDSASGPGNMGGSSLLAMLVPSLMQMSKSRNQKSEDRLFSDDSRTQLPQGCAVKENIPCGNISQEAMLHAAKNSNFKPAGIESKINGIDGDTISNEKGNNYEFQVKDVKSAKDQRVPYTDKLGTPLMGENFNPYSRIEGKLDTLLSKMEKMELFCSRFDDSMMRPVSSIESRLQRLEQQFDSFSVEIKSLVPPLRMSAPDGLYDTTNLQHKSHNDGKAGTCASTTNRQPGLVVRAPEFSLEDYDVTDENPVELRVPSLVPRVLVQAPDFICEPQLTREKLHDDSFSPFNFALSSEKECKTSPGLVVKVPEFPNDEDDEVEEDKETEVDDHDGGHKKSGDALIKSTVDSFKGKTPVSIDGALASALEAFLTSAKGTSSSKSVACTASNSTDENTKDSSGCSFSPEEANEIPTKYDSAGLFSSTPGYSNKVATVISSQEVDAPPHTSLCKGNLPDNVEVNVQNNAISSDMMVFPASTEPLGFSSQLHSVVGSVEDEIHVNQQEDGSNSDMMPSVANNEHLSALSQLPKVFDSIDDGARVNKRKSALNLAEFIAARNANSCKKVTSDVCCGHDGAEILSFERTSVGAGENVKDISQLLLLKKALEVDEADNKVEASCEGSTYADPQNGANGLSIRNTKKIIRLSVSGGTDSVLCHCSVIDGKRWTENSCLKSSLIDRFTKPGVEHCWSDLSSSESFDGAPAREAVSLESAATGNYGDDPFAGCSGVNPIAGEELQKVYDLLYEYKDDILGMDFVAKGTTTSNPSLEVLLAESSDSEAQISDVENTDDDDESRLFSTFSSSDDEAPATNEPIVNVVDLPVPSEAHSSSNNEPLVDVVDLPNPSGVSEHLASADDLSKPSETFSAGISGEHPDSLI